MTDRLKGMTDKYERMPSRIEKHPADLYVIKCGGMEIHAIGADNLAIQCASVLTECQRLRWIIREADKRIGGSRVLQVVEETQPDYEVIKIEPETP